MGNALAGKVAIVTGSSRGIGKAIAKALAAEGAKVAVVARTDKDGDSKLPGSIATTVQEIAKAGGATAPFHCDLTDDGQVQGLVDGVLTRFGRIDVLVNNAAIIFHTNVAETPLRRWDLIWKVNMRAILACNGAVLPHLIKQRGGSIINVTSRATLSRSPGGSAYGMFKTALEYYSEVLAKEVAEQGIAVNCLDPGGVKTEGAVMTAPPDRDWTGWDEPWRCGPPAAWLARQTAQTYTGQVLRRSEFELFIPPRA